MLCCVLGLALATLVVAAPYGYDEDQYIQQLLRDQQMQYGDLDQQNGYDLRGQGQYAQDFGKHDFQQQSQSEWGLGQQYRDDQSEANLGQVVQDFGKDDFQQQSQSEWGLGQQYRDDQLQANLGQVVQDFGKDDFQQQSQFELGQHYMDVDQSEANLGQVVQDFGKDDFQQQSQFELGQHYTDIDQSEANLGQVVLGVEAHDYKPHKEDTSRVQTEVGQIQDFDQSHDNQVVQDLGLEGLSQITQEQDVLNGGETEDLTMQQQTQDFGQEETQQTQDLGLEFEALGKTGDGKPEKVIEGLDQHGIQQETQDLTRQFIDEEQSQSQMGNIEDMSQHGMQPETQDMGQEFIDLTNDMDKGDDIQQQTQDLTQQFAEFGQSRDQVGKIDVFDQTGMQQQTQDMNREFNESDLIILPDEDNQQVENWGLQNKEQDKAGDVEVSNQQEDYLNMDLLGVGQKDDQWSQQNNAQVSFDNDQQTNGQIIIDQWEDEYQTVQSTFNGMDKAIEQLVNNNDDTVQEYQQLGDTDLTQQKQLEQALDDELLIQLQNQQGLGYDQLQQMQNKEDFTQNKEDFTQNKEDFTQNKEDFTQNKEDFTQNKEDFTQNKEDFTLNKEDFTQNKEDFTQNKEDFVQNKEDFTQNKEDFTQNKEDFVQNKEDFTQNKEDFTQNKEDFTQNKEDFTQNKEDFTQNKEDFTQNKEDFTQNNEEFTPPKFVPELSVNEVTPLHGRHYDKVNSGSVEGSHSWEQPSELPEDYHTKPPSFWTRHWGKAKAKAKALASKIQVSLG